MHVILGPKSRRLRSRAERLASKQAAEVNLHLVERHGEQWSADTESPDAEPDGLPRAERGIER